MIEYYLKKIIHLFENNKCEILHLKMNFNDNFDMLSYIYCIENMHRGSNIIKIAEYILVKYFQKYCIKKDFSIGPFQVKKSFCVSNNLYLESLDKLLELHSSCFLYTSDAADEGCAVEISVGAGSLKKKERWVVRGWGGG
ncbi:hypothetical protein, partial [Staphylococcus aureus]|uniref:hypothetical protein n=1 Tax=Staphylococcus aureus TaxID=1280 RepID=UPI0037DCEB6F